MDVELLYFDGCPGYEPLLGLTRALLDVHARGQRVRLVRIDSIDDAVVHRFLGSPSLRVDRHDVEPGAYARDDYGMKCRLYDTPAGLRGTPPEAWVEEALRTAAAGEVG